MWDKQWLEQFPIIEFKANDLLFHVDKPAKYNYYLISGICAQTYPTADGNELVLTYYLPGKMLGINLHRFGNANPLNFVARTNCVCYKIPIETVEQKVKDDTNLCYYLFQESVTEQEQRTDLHIARVLGGGISILCFTLKLLALPFNNDTYIVNPVFTNVELSKFCGIHEVSISRLLTRLTQENILTKTPDGIIIHNISRLTEYICSGE